MLIFHCCLSKTRDSEAESSDAEEGEVKEDELHPLVSVTDINPEEIPDIPVNKFLMRGGPTNMDKGKKDKRSDKDRGEFILY